MPPSPPARSGSIVWTEVRRASAVLGALMLLAACREQTPPEIAPGRLTRTAGDAPRSIRALVPPECRAGEVFQKLDTGEAALMLVGTGFRRGDTVFWNGHALRTAFGHSRLLTAAVPPDLLRPPGPAEIRVEDAIDRSQPSLRAEFLVRASP